MEQRDIEQHPVYGFRARRRQIANSTGSESKQSIVAVMDEDLDWLDYSVETYRTDGLNRESVFWSFLEWIDQNGEPHQVILPGLVIDRLTTHIAGLKKSAAANRAKRGARTRQNNIDHRASCELPSGECPHEAHGDDKMVEEPEPQQTSGLIN